VSQWEKFIERILSGKVDANLSFEEVSKLLQRLGYRLTIRGSHHIYKQPNWPALNLQPLGKVLNHIR
jgi:hypothetical protein